MKRLTVAVVAVAAVVGLAGCPANPPACADADGPYRRGQDPEYGLYEDRDHDGVVCE